MVGSAGSPELMPSHVEMKPEILSDSRPWGLMAIVNSSLFFFFFCHTARLVGSQFPGQELNPGPAVKALNPNHSTSRELPRRAF